MNLALLGTIFAIISMAAGGFLAGRYRKNLSLYPGVDACLGVLGGKLGSELWSMLGIAAGGSAELGLTSIFGNLLAGFVGGLTLLAIVFQGRKIFGR